VLAIAEKVAWDKEVLRKDKISTGWWRKFWERQECYQQISTIAASRLMIQKD